MKYRRQLAWPIPPDVAEARNPASVSFLFVDVCADRTVFPLATSSEEELRLAVAARKSRPVRSKSEAKREAKQQRLKGTALRV